MASTSGDSWFKVENEKEVLSPSLLIYPERIRENINRMIKIAGYPGRLRPHVKTHKMPGIVKMQVEAGITKFKCATIAEAEMTARSGASDILLAIQPVGPNLSRFFTLKKTFPDVKISCIADCEDVVISLSDAARKSGLDTHVWLDINIGMNRTGVLPGEKALRLFRRIMDSPKLIASGIHAYDGHLHQSDPEKRRTACDEAFNYVTNLAEDLNSEGISDVKIVAGGTPTFPIHALREDVELSPGTLLLWDWGYSDAFEDLSFLHAAVLFTRVISKPGKDLLCLDLGHKAVASEMAQPRVKILGINKYKITGHNEEHMVVTTPEAASFHAGDPVYCIPWHICPTVDRHEQALVVEDNKVVDSWTVEARKRKLTI